MSRPILTKIAYIHATSKSIDCSDDEKAGKVIKNLEEVSWKSLVNYPGSITVNDAEKLVSKINKFINLVKWEKCNIQVMLNFFLDQMEKALDYTRNKDRRQLIFNLMSALNEAYIFFSERDGEDVSMINEGINASKVWEELMGDW